VNEWANPVHEVTTLEGEWIRLRPPSRGDYPAMFRWRCDATTPHLWTLNRRAATFEEFVADLERALPQALLLLVVDRDSDKLIGYAQAYDLRPWDGHLQVGFYLEPPFRRRPHFPEATLLVLETLFRWYPLRKAYVEVYEFADGLRQMLARLGFREEGFTPDHFWHDGRSWGVHRMALYAQEMPLLKEELSRMLSAREGVQTTAHGGA
jgi:RimJ/RimL family protein N-acetyltransferase